MALLRLAQMLLLEVMSSEPCWDEPCWEQLLHARVARWLCDLLMLLSVRLQRNVQVTPEEWCRYYAMLSASITDDDEFELMMRCENAT